MCKCILNPAGFSAVCGLGFSTVEPSRRGNCRYYRQLPAPRPPPAPALRSGSGLSHEQLIGFEIGTGGKNPGPGGGTGRAPSSSSRARPGLRLLLHNYGYGITYSAFRYGCVNPTVVILGVGLSVKRVKTCFFPFHLKDATSDARTPGRRYKVSHGSRRQNQEYQHHTVTELP